MTIRISIKRVALAEPNETFILKLTAPTNAQLGIAQAIGTITDSVSGETKRKVMLPVVTR